MVLTGVSALSQSFFMSFDLPTTTPFVERYGNTSVILSSANTHSYKKRNVRFDEYVANYLGPRSLEDKADLSWYQFGDNKVTLCFCATGFLPGAATHALRLTKSLNLVCSMMNGQTSRSTTTALHTHVDFAFY
jgi:hypothetical protein